MADERKTTMLSGRVPVTLAERLNYVIRNTEGPETANRSAAMRSSLEAWLPDQERQIEVKLGATFKKARP